MLSAHPLFSLVALVIGLLGGLLEAQQGGAAPRDSAKPTATTKRLATNHLQITTYVTDATVTPGAFFSVVFDITPRDGLHVYAPGAENYRIVRVTTEPNPLLILRPTQYPPSEIYYFAPLKERVPVFQEPFRLTQPMAVDASPQYRPVLERTGSVTVKATLDYQACDARICYPPQSVPVSHTVRLR